MASNLVIMNPDKIQGHSIIERKEEENGYSGATNNLCFSGPILLSSNCLEVHILANETGEHVC